MVDVWIMSAVGARCEWLSEAIASDRTIRTKGTAATFSFLRTLMSETEADLAVVDLDSNTNPDLLRDWLLELLDQIPLLCLCAAPDPVVFNRMLTVAAGGMLPSDASAALVMEAIKCVASGLLIFDGGFVRDVHRRHEDETAPAQLLTPRESEVLELLAEGLGNKEIAAQLKISQHTIKFHIRSILAKLGASSRTEAVSVGLRSGLIDL